MRTRTLARSPEWNLRQMRRRWNALSDGAANGLHRVEIRKAPRAVWISCGDLPASFRDYVEAHLTWAAGTDTYWPRTPAPPAGAPFHAPAARLHPAPDIDWGWPMDISRQIDHQSFPRPKANRVRTSDEIAALGRKLIEGAEAETETGSPNKVAALDYRDGLMLLVLACGPPRCENLAGPSSSEGCRPACTGADRQFSRKVHRSAAGGERRRTSRDQALAWARQDNLDTR